MKAITRVSLLALAIVAAACPLTQAGLITVTSSRFYYLQIASVPTAAKDLERDVLTFPTNIRESQILVTNEYGQGSSTFNGSASLVGSATQTLNAQISGNVNVRSPAATGSVSYRSEGYLESFYNIDFDVTQPVITDLGFAIGLNEFNSLQTGAVSISPYTDIGGGLRNLTTNQSIASFTTTGNWSGLLNPGRYRVNGYIYLTRRLAGGTTGDPEFTSFDFAGSLVRSTLRVTPVPEPATLSAGAIGVVMLGMVRALRRRS